MRLATYKLCLSCSLYFFQPNEIDCFLSGFHCFSSLVSIQMNESDVLSIPTLFSLHPNVVSVIAKKLKFSAHLRRFSEYKPSGLCIIYCSQGSKTQSQSNKNPLNTVPVIRNTQSSLMWIFNLRLLFTASQIGTGKVVSANRSRAFCQCLFSFP